MRSPDPLKEAAILDAALRLVLREGLSGLKMSDLASSAGVATGTVYVYFKDKEQLLHRLHQHVIGQIVRVHQQGYDPGAPFMKAFEKLWRNHAQAIIQLPESYAFLDQYERSWDGGGSKNPDSDSIIRPLAELLDRGREEGLIRDAPTALLAIQLRGALRELGRWHRQGAIGAGPAVLSKAFVMAWDSIRR